MVLSLRNEIRRLLVRRITRVSLLIGAALAAVVGTATFAQHESGGPDLSAARATAEAAEAECREWTDEPTMSEADIALTCAQDPSWYVVDRRFHFQSVLWSSHVESWDLVVSANDRHPSDVGLGADAAASGVPVESPAPGLDGSLPALGLNLVFLAGLLGASYVGADWRSRSIETQLTWESDRRRLLGSRLVAVGLVAGAVAVAVAVLILAAQVPSAVWRGDFVGTGAGFWWELAMATLRIGVAAAFVAMLTAAIANTLRNTAGGFATLIGLSFGGVILTQVLLPALVGLDLGANLRAWLGSGDVTREVFVDTGAGDTWSFQEIVHGPMLAAAVLALWVGSAVALSTTIFTRRDIT